MSTGENVIFVNKIIAVCLTACYFLYVIDFHQCLEKVVILVITYIERSGLLF